MTEDEIAAECEWPECGFRCAETSQCAPAVPALSYSGRTERAAKAGAAAARDALAAALACSSEPHPPHASQVPGFAGCPGTPPVGVQPEPAGEATFGTGTHPQGANDYTPAVPVAHPEPGDRAAGDLAWVSATDVNDGRPQVCRWDDRGQCWEVFGEAGVIFDDQADEVWPLDDMRAVAAAVAAVRADLVGQIEAHDLVKVIRGVPWLPVPHAAAIVRGVREVSS